MLTHTVSNQSKALVDYDLFNSDAPLVESIVAHGASGFSDKLTAFGRFTGSSAAIALGQAANANPPILSTHDRFGYRIDRVDFHPAYHDLMSASIAHGVHALPWQTPVAGAHLARAAMLYMAFQNEAGHCCPISMTYSSVPSLEREPALAALLKPLILSSEYDGRFLPLGEKKGITLGMGMTEKQGGSDVRANSTVALKLQEITVGGHQLKPYTIVGHKWFCSAPMSDAFLVLAQTAKGVTCYLVPRHDFDGKVNQLRIQRLKDKLGNHSNASSEIEYENAIGYLIGEEGRGVATIIEMVGHTRLDCVLGATALMRQATVQALNHCRGRAAFGKLLVDQPLMRNVLADLLLESESSTRLAMRVAASFDKQGESSHEADFRRLGTAIAKYWVCKRAPMVVAEALECFGGNGYVEAGPMPRLFRESPLLGIWEGSGNVICLDVLRAMAREPETVAAVVSEIKSVRGFSRRLDAHASGIVNQLGKMARKPGDAEINARRLVEALALSLAAVEMVKHAPEHRAAAFVAARLGTGRTLALGGLPASIKAGRIVDEAMPV